MLYFFDVGPCFRQLARNGPDSHACLLDALISKQPRGGCRNFFLPSRLLLPFLLYSFLFYSRGLTVESLSVVDPDRRLQYVIAGQV